MDAGAKVDGDGIVREILIQSNIAHPYSQEQYDNVDLGTVYSAQFDT